MSRSQQLVILVVLAAAAVYVTMQAYERMTGDRCGITTYGLDCSFPKEKPRRTVIVREGETTA